MNCWAQNVCRVVLVFAIVSAGVRDVRAQSTTPEQTAADSYYNAKDWQKAAPAYEALAKANPANGQDWYRWGVALAGIGQYQKPSSATTRPAASVSINSPFSCEQRKPMRASVTGKKLLPSSTKFSIPDTVQEKSSHPTPISSC